MCVRASGPAGLEREDSYSRLGQGVVVVALAVLWHVSLQQGVPLAFSVTEPCKF